MSATSTSGSGTAGRDVPAADPPPTLAAVFAAQYRPLVRLAAMLLDDPHAAEDMAQEAYVRVAVRRDRVRDPHKTLAYLRQTVVNLCRTANRRGALARRFATVEVPDVPDIQDGAVARFQQQAVVAGLRALPRRHREVVVLRFYLDLSVEQTALALGLSTGAVKAYSSRGLEQLRRRLADEGNDLR
jgi:RNA polymerase sigma-70 factor (sigma-E family)